MGSIRRVFLGWDRPLVETAAAWLGREWAVVGGGTDLSGVVVVVPGGRLGRNIVDRIGRLTGGVIGGAVTIDQFLDAVLDVGEANRASSWLRRLCWMAAAGELSGEELEAVWPAALRESFAQKLAAAETIDATHQRLAGEGIEFRQVARAVDRAGLPDGARWRALERLEQRYLDMVSGLGACDLASERVAAARAGRLKAARVVLVGLAEVPGLARTVLGRPELSTTALVAAPEALRDAFDDFGAVKPEVWRERRLDIADEKIIVVDGPMEQARVALAAAGDPSFTGGAEAALDPADVVICVPDEEVRRAIERTAESLAAPADNRHPLRVRSAAGVPCLQAAPARFLQAVAAFLADPEFPQFLALVRHADVETRVVALARQRQQLVLDGQQQVIEFLDEYARKYVHGVVAGTWLGVRDARTASMHQVLDAVYASVREILGVLWHGGESSQPRPASAWAAAIVAAVRRVYVEVTNDADERCCAAIESACRELRRGADLGDAEPAMTAAAAVQILLGELARTRRPLPVDPGAVELVGWLEAVHESAPILVLTSMNEGTVPRSAADPLLPEALRRELGAATRDVVFARDKYLLEQALACRTRAVLIAGRKKQDNSKSWPSRLLLAADDQTVVGRLARFLPAAAGPSRDQAMGLQFADSGARSPPFEVMPVTQDRPITAVSVTGFRRFMECPYAFYLQDVLGLGEVPDPAAEMDAGVFGTFVHRVLDCFARGPAADATGPDAIRRGVDRALEQVVREDLGDDPPTAVAVQREQAAHRLAGFVEFQAQRAAEGWRILHSEWKPSRPVTLEAAGQQIAIRGRIDRIDWNASTRELALLDYKTAEGWVKTVEGMYKDGRVPHEWTDLQMPLYRLLAGELMEIMHARSMVLGYVTLPKNGKIELVPATWTDAELEKGVEAARGLLEDMLKGQWRRWGDFPPDDGVIAALCGVSVLVTGHPRGEEETP